jgi:hypothetical protein
MVPPCGATVLASFVASNGNLDRLDVSCMSQVNSIKFGVSSHLSEKFFAASDAFEGPAMYEIVPNQHYAAHSSGWKAAAIIACVCAALLVLALVHIMYRYRQQMQSAGK